MDTMRPANGAPKVPGRLLGPSRAKLRTAAWLSWIPSVRAGRMVGLTLDAQGEVVDRTPGA